MIHSVGVIGGADGPTAVFVSGNPVIPVTVLLAVIALVGIGAHLFRNKRGN